jgi:hypothetical protein
LDAWSRLLGPQIWWWVWYYDAIAPQLSKLSCLDTPLRYRFHARLLGIWKIIQPLEPYPTRSRLARHKSSLAASNQQTAHIGACLPV